MNKILKQYKQMIEWGSKEVIDEWISRGDWMLLTTNRIALQKLSQANKLDSKEIEVLKALDRRFKKMLTNSQLKQFEKMEPGMPISEWWG